MDTQQASQQVLLDPPPPVRSLAPGSTGSSGGVGICTHMCSKFYLVSLCRISCVLVMFV